MVVIDVTEYFGLQWNGDPFNYLKYLLVVTAFIVVVFSQLPNIPKEISPVIFNSSLQMTHIWITELGQNWFR